ncbi:cubilin isoform X1 [Magallana gigas]|uniref:cubilin isoform X1 n=2 Tax=Magallana gigas TaxID=29159 RepID=UPI003341B7F2
MDVQMYIYWILGLFGILLNYFSDAMGQCVRSGLDVPVPNYGMSVLSYPDDSSPNYGQGLNCKWLFRSADTTLKLIFLVTEQVQCGDVLLAFDGTTMGDRKIGDVFCSPQTAPSVSPFYVTSSNQMLLSFITDSTTHAQLEKGFKVEILSARPVAYEAEACNSNIKTLVATKNEEVLTSPYFPENYKRDTNCFWNITSPTGDGTIRINVLFLDTDVYEGVCYDNITTYDGEERKVLCDTKSLKPKSLLFNSSFVQIIFYSDDQIENRGFLLMYSFLGEAATSESSTSATKITTEISTTEATPITSNAETTTMSISETTISTSETTTMSTAKSTTKSTSGKTAISTAESTTKSTAELTTTMSTSETTMSTSETTTMSTLETTTGTITTETTILETTHSKTLSSGYPTAGTTQNRTLLLTTEAVISLVVCLMFTLVFVIIACIVFCFAKNKKRKRSTDFSCSFAPPLWRRHFIEVDYLRN